MKLKFQYLDTAFRSIIKFMFTYKLHKCFIIYSKNDLTEQNKLDFVSFYNLCNSFIVTCTETIETRHHPIGSDNAHVTFILD